MPLFQIMNSALSLAESGSMPDVVIRAGIRRLLKQRLREVTSGTCETREADFRTLLAEMNAGPIAVNTDAANEQHYEVPAEFYRRCLGPRLKYSSCYWSDTTATLQDAEEDALRQTCETAQLQDGQQILELGCGWGSLTLWIAERYPGSTITAVSNSASQREFILEQAAARDLNNVDVVTCDINEFKTDAVFDRVVSVEMFEHVRNHRELMRRISTWLVAGGKLFVHIFCHDRFTYLFEDEGQASWMTRHFFSGGVMPGKSLLLNHQQDLSIEHQTCWNGQHYAKTCNAWLQNQDAAKSELMPLFRDVYGSSDAVKWFGRWRMFYMACAELFAFNEGNEWYVSHYRFEKRHES